MCNNTAPHVAREHPVYNNLICSSTFIASHHRRVQRLPWMTHLGTMLHFQLPTSSIITRPPAATDAHHSSIALAIRSLQSCESDACREPLYVKSIFDGDASNLMSDVRCSPATDRRTVQDDDSLCLLCHPGTTGRPRHSLSTHYWHIVDPVDLVYSLLDDFCSKCDFCDDIAELPF